MSFTTEEIAELYAEETAPIAEPVSRRRSAADAYDAAAYAARVRVARVDTAIRTTVVGASVRAAVDAVHARDGAAVRERAARVAAKLGAWADGVPLAALGGDCSAASVFARRELVRRMLAAGLSAYRVAALTTFQHEFVRRIHATRRRH